MKKKAFITGITGQDGSYLAELLLEKDYEVHGMVRRLSVGNPEQRYERINHILGKVNIHSGTLESYSRLIELFDKIRPDECYHLAAQSYVHESFEDGFSTLNQNINGTHHILSALKIKAPDCKFYFAGTSEMFGKVKEVPQNELTPFHPRSPYGISKLTGFELTRNFRESYGIYACTGFLFNHESPRRGYEFITKKIVHELVKIKHGQKNKLILGNLDAKRDWGYAKDYVEAMWLMLQQEIPDDFVISTGKTYSINDFLDKCCDILDLRYEKVDLHEKTSEEAKELIDALNETDFFIIQHPDFFRPAEVDLLVGDSSKAKEQLGWSPKVHLDELIQLMIDDELTTHTL